MSNEETPEYNNPGVSSAVFDKVWTLNGSPTVAVTYTTLQQLN
jgi:hypothetical protein